ncbi:CocE/NonD family hydrolase [Nonomuraea sp. B1E8]|uniref:CocE/NonD family hydrolase n=1 Tax=unclassified Nonomuraea TaxID=2593643 RepID=UPI00325CE4E1
MSLATRLLALIMGLPPATSTDVAVDKGLRVAMRDGVELAADRYYPRGDPRAMLVLIRTPYGRSRAVQGWGTIARAIAERGYQVVVQSTRGTFDSGGDFEPGVAEAADGLATVEWLRQQPWFPGAFATYGQSYVGYVQWALARSRIPEWKAAVIGVAPSDWASGWTHPNGAFSIGNALYWIYAIAPVTRTRTSASESLRALIRPRPLRTAENHLPMGTSDRIALGEHVNYYQRWVASDGHDGYTREVDFRDCADNLPPTHLSTGWYDFFVNTTLTDYVALRRAGRPVRLLVGPGGHSSGQNGAASREQFPWLAAHGRGSGVPLPDTPVRVYIMGAGHWADLADWPPPDSLPTPWHLRQGGYLTPDPDDSAASEPSRYRYDPTDPTPNVGGAFPHLPWRCGPKDNRALEARPDVLTFTTEVLDRDLTIIGWVEADLFVRSSLEHTDFFARLCDVAPDGRSTNICDGLLRLRPGSPRPTADGVRRLRISLMGTAYRFARGHRIRLQVSSGAHPRFTRNLGTGEPEATATITRAADQEVLHDRDHPSSIVLPLIG